MGERAMEGGIGVVTASIYFVSHRNNPDVNRGVEKSPLATTLDW
jgi:hypothetical protein